MKKSRTTAKSSSRRKLEADYKTAWELIPESPICAKCGIAGSKFSMERHHPASRRKAAFLFTFMMHSDCHKWVHENPAEAELCGLLWPGRHRKTLTIEDARHLVKLTGRKVDYAVKILQKFAA